MRLAEISVHSQPLPVKNGPYRLSHCEVHELDSTVVKIVTDTGLTGWGEPCPIGPTYQPHHATGARAALAEMARPADCIRCSCVGPWTACSTNTATPRTRSTETGG